MTTLLEVANAAGVSRTAASYAYGHPERLSTVVRARILDTARQLGYAGPDSAARTLRTKRSGTFGVVITEHLSYAFDDPAAVSFLQGVARVAERHDLGITLLAIDATTPPERPLRAAIDGLIGYSLDGPHPILDEVVRRRLPTVLVDSPPRPGCSSVSIDDVAAARTAARHLLELGHRRFGIIADRLPPTAHRGDDRSVSERRLAGYRSALRAAKIPAGDVAVAAVGLNCVADGALGAAQLLDASIAPTAILAATDLLALGAMDAAAERGLLVGRDVSIVGFDDLPAAEARGLTTIAQPLTAKGTSAAELLMEQLQLVAPTPSPVRHVHLPTSLVVRTSTARPR